MVVLPVSLQLVLPLASARDAAGGPLNRLVPMSYRIPLPILSLQIQRLNPQAGQPGSGISLTLKNKPGLSSSLSQALYSAMILISAPVKSNTFNTYLCGMLGYGRSYRLCRSLVAAA